MQEVEPVNKTKSRRKATEDPIANKEESLGSSGSQEVNFEGSMELDEDIDIDAFEMERSLFIKNVLPPQSSYLRNS